MNIRSCFILSFIVGVFIPASLACAGVSKPVGRNSNADILDYWKSESLKDSLKGHDRKFIEDKFLSFNSLVDHCNDTSVYKKAVFAMLDEAASDEYVFSVLAQASYDLLYDPDSPYLNEEKYIPYMQYLSESDRVDDAIKERNAFLLEAALKNRVGTIATDFSFSDTAGNKTSLRSLTQNPDQKILLIFFDPDCETCQASISKLIGHQNINNEIEKGNLLVLAVYPGDDYDSWLPYASSLPDNWVVGIDPEDIEMNESYYIRSFPTFYLLGADKKVLAKDISIEYLTNFFQ